MNRTKTFCLAILSLFAFAGTGAFGQITFINPVDTVVGYLDVPEDDELSIHWDAENTSEDTLVLMVTRIFVDTISPFNYPYVANGEGAYERFCWGPLCYNFGSNSSSINPAMLVTMPPGAIDTTLVTDYYHNGHAGISTLRYCLHGLNEDPESGTCFDITYRIEQAFSVPNLLQTVVMTRLTNDRWSYDLGLENEGRFRLVDMQGRQVYSVNLRGVSGSFQVPLFELSTGAYIAVLEGGSGSRSSQTVFIHGH
jgi:hypothetical protein